jgi:glucose-1-phosphate cytidylyltransferase
VNCVIFSGGFGTRMNNGVPGKLKPLTEVAGKEILRHILSIYEYYGIKDFTLLGGYRIEDLHAFAAKYTELNIKVIDTGEGTPTGGRLLLAREHITSPFLLTYGDSLTNYNLHKCIEFKAATQSDFTISVFNKKLEYGILKTNDESILEEILEKTYSVKINAGFYMLDARVFDYIQSADESFEIDVLPRILADKNIRIGCFKVDFWHPMDTPSDQANLSKILLSHPKILFE